MNKPQGSAAQPEHTDIPTPSELAFLHAPGAEDGPEAPSSAPPLVGGVVPAPAPHPVGNQRGPQETVDLDLLVWDAPNIDMTLSNVIGGRPTPSSRPRFDAVARWLLSTASEGAEVEGCVFANVPPGGAVSMRGWIEALRSFGYAVFARPKLNPDDDVDADMLTHIQERARTRKLRRVIVASGDGRNFLEPLEDLGRAGVEVSVLSFAEVAGYAQESDYITFVDLEDVPGAFTGPLPRVRLDNLPEGGAWLPPTRPMRDLLAEAHA